LFIRAEDWVRYMPVWVMKTDGNPQALVPRDSPRDSRD
jgi:hypothetical protein